jgi:uncharacterized membrane protein YbhN (UPF0104 family)
VALKIGPFSLNTSWLKIIIKLLLISLAVTILVRIGAFNRDLLSSLHLQLSNAFFSLIIVTIIAFLLTWRWLIILTGAGIISHYWKLCRIVFIGFFYNTMLPGNTGYDLAVISYATTEHEVDKTLTACSVIVDRLLGIITLLLISLLSLLYLLMLGGSTLALKRLIKIVIFLSLTGFLILAFIGWALKHQRLKSFRIRGFLLKDLLRLRPKGQKLLLIMLISLFVHGLIIFNMINCAHILGYKDINIPIWLAVVPLALLINQLSITPGGLGVGEFSLFTLLALFDSGHNPNPGALVFILFRLSFFLLALPGAFFLFFRPYKK